MKTRLTAVLALLVVPALAGGYSNGDGPTFTVTLGNPTYPKDLLKLPPDVQTDGMGWTSTNKDGNITLEVALPKKSLLGFGANKRGLMAGQVSWATGGKSWKLNTKNAEQHHQWPLWKLEK